MAWLLYHRERIGGWVGAVTRLATLEYKGLLPLLGTEHWTVQLQPGYCLVYSYSVTVPLDPAVLQFAFCSTIGPCRAAVSILQYHWTLQCSSFHSAVPLDPVAQQFPFCSTIAFTPPLQFLIVHNHAGSSCRPV
jgi:hypothetical protein